MKQFLVLKPGLVFDTVDPSQYDSTLEALQDAVSGLIEDATAYFDLPKGIAAYVNEEGFYSGKPMILCYSCWIDGKVDVLPLFGNVVFCHRDADGNDMALSKADLIATVDALSKMSITTKLIPLTRYPVLFQDFTGLVTA